MLLNFNETRESLAVQFSDTKWIEESGIEPSELEALALKIEAEYPNALTFRAKTFELIANRAKIAVDTLDIFQDKLKGGTVMLDQRQRRERAVKEKYLGEESERTYRAWHTYGTYDGMTDFGHTSPNTRLMLRIGFTGLLERVELAAKKAGLTERQKEYYAATKTVLSAIITVAKRLAAAIKPYNAENAEALLNIASGAPKNTYEAMQLLVLYYFLHEYVAGTRVRTLGRLDVLLDPFIKEDLASGRYTDGEISEMLRYFLHKFWSAKVPYDLPFCLGGIDEDGIEVTSETSYRIVRIYDELNIYSPKIHIRVSDKTPKDFIKLVLSCIRGGNSSFVFVNDTVAIESLTRIGIDKLHARNYVPIGCYEPAVWGVEIGCTGNGGVNLPKAIELVLCGGKDFKTGEVCGVQCDLPKSFDELLTAVKTQIAFMTDSAASYVTSLERLYPEINADPILSCQYEESVSRGVDVYEGGAKYNNSSLYFYGIATLVDSLAAIKKLVFDDGECTLDELREALFDNWAKNPRLRAKAIRLREKYGNNNPTADALTVELADFCAGLLFLRPNGRGGVFKPALFSIDHVFHLGTLTMATPDGRFAGEPLSKNLSASVGMDRGGITALISSVTKFDHAAYSTGSVLDIMLHPSAVSGEDGLEAFFGILMTYIKKGGFAMHGNVFDSKTLIAAQKNPEKYKNLQVRVCGWNAYFVNLSRIEQDTFIKQAESYR